MLPILKAGSRSYSGSCVASVKRYFVNTSASVPMSILLNSGFYPSVLNIVLHCVQPIRILLTCDCWEDVLKHHDFPFLPSYKYGWSQQRIVSKHAAIRRCSSWCRNQHHFVNQPLLTKMVPVIGKKLKLEMFWNPPMEDGFAIWLKYSCQNTATPLTKVAEPIVIP